MTNLGIVPAVTEPVNGYILDISWDDDDDEDALIENDDYDNDYKFICIVF